MPLVEPRRCDAGRRPAVSVNHANRAANVTYRPRDFVAASRANCGRRADVPGDSPDAGALALCLGRHAGAQHGPRNTGLPTTMRSAKSTASSPTCMRRARGQGRARKRHRRRCSPTTARRSAPTRFDDAARPGRRREIWDSLWGHGTSVMSPHQYQRAACDARLRPREASGTAQATTTGRYRSRTCGRRSRNSRPARPRGRRRHLAGALPGGSRARRRRLRPRSASPKPTSIRPRRWRASYEASAIVDEAPLYYEIDPRSGWVQFRESGCPS